MAQERAISEYDSKYGRRLWNHDARKNYHQLANERKDRALNAMRHQPIHWEPITKSKTLHVKNVESAAKPNTRIRSPTNTATETEPMENDFVTKAQPVSETDQKKQESRVSDQNCKCCQRNIVSPKPKLQEEVGTQSNRESSSNSREWLVHIDFDPQRKAEENNKRDIQTIKVTTTRINEESKVSLESEKENLHSDRSRRSSHSTASTDKKPPPAITPSPSKEKGKKSPRTDEKPTQNLSKENERDLILNRLLRPMIRSVPPVKPKPNINHQVSGQKDTKAEDAQRNQARPTPESQKFYSTQSFPSQSKRKNPPFAMYGGNDHGIRQTYNVKSNNKEVHSSALRAKKERERLQIFRKEVEKKRPPMIKKPQVSMKLFCDAVCAQNKPRETDSWSTEYKRNFTSSYDFKPINPVFKVIKEREKPRAGALSKFLG